MEDRKRAIIGGGKFKLILRDEVSDVSKHKVFGVPKSKILRALLRIWKRCWMFTSVRLIHDFLL